MTATVWPPGPKGRILRGNVPEFGPDWIGALLRYAREYGDFVPLRLGLRRAVLLSHPDYVEQVLLTKHEDFARTGVVRYRRRPLGGGVPTSNSDSWRRQRRLVQAAFRRERVLACGDVAVDCAERMLRTWHDGDRRDVHADMLGLAGDAIGGMLLGADSPGEAAEFSAAFLATMEGDADPPMNLLLLWLADRLPVPASLKSSAAARRLDDIGYAIIGRRRRAGAEERNDLLSVLLSARDRDGSGLTDEELHAQVVNLFLAGYETLATALFWTCYLVARHPEVEHRLVAELRAVLGGRSPAVTDLPHLRYTELVAMEALRLCPPLGTTKRETVRDSEIGGYAVPRGTIVLMSQWVLHRDPRYFEQPESFQPGRWADGLTRRLPKCAYFPFGAGPHTCTGNRLAMVELVLMLATMAQRFRIEFAPEQEVPIESSVTLRPRGGVQAAVYRR
jgi:cytochrome P450